MPSALLLVNMGGPGCLDDVEPYLRAIFLDPAILPLPGLVRSAVARAIARRRAPIVRERYQRLGGRSPLLAWTERQASLVARALPDRVVAHAYRYTSPTIEEALMMLRGSDRVTLLPMFPHYTGAMTGSVLREATRVARREQMALDVVSAWGSDSAVLAVWRKSLAAGLARAGHGARVLFVAHGVPLRDVNRGDPYPAQVEATARALAPDRVSWSLAYQSRVGPLRWTEPYLDDEIARLTRTREPIVVMPLSFAADCLETMYDLDDVAHRAIVSAGVRRVVRVGALNDDAEFISALARMADDAIEKVAA